MVFAAASLRDLLGEMAVAWRRQGGEPLAINFAGSNVLARQLLARPAADVFISADSLWMDRLQEAGLLAPGSRRVWLSNRLVVIAQADSELARAGPLTSAAELARVPCRHLALADPRAVPAGRYARRWLESIEHPPGTLWDALADRVAPTADVRAARGLVEADPEILGIVYRTDAQTSERVQVIWEVAAPDGPQIRYAAAALARRPEPERAASLLDFLTGEHGVAAARRHGFVTTDE